MCLQTSNRVYKLSLTALILRPWHPHADDLGDGDVGRHLHLVVAEAELPLVLGHGHTAVLDRQVAADRGEVPLDPLRADLAVVHHRPALIGKF